MRLLIVDGGNIVMRCAFGGENAPEDAASSAVGNIIKAIRFSQASHLIVAVDGGGETWRHKLCKDYKSTRTTDTAPYMAALVEECNREQWLSMFIPQWEADDIVATLAKRARGVLAEVIIYSSDSDMHPLADRGTTILKPLSGGEFKWIEPWLSPQQLVDIKAMTGESGDNIAGVDGIGPKRASELIQKYSTLDAVLVAGENNACKQSAKVFDQKEAVIRARMLITLNTSAPIPPIRPSLCAL